MPRFAYQALDAKGRAKQGEMVAPNVEAVVADLRQLRYTVTNVQEKVDPLGAVRAWIKSRKRIHPYALVLFTRQFATLFNSGVPMMRALDGMLHQAVDEKLTEALRGVHRDVKQGLSLANAMSKHPTAFSPVYVSLIRAGEKGGALGEILNRTADFLERDLTVRRKFQAAVTYPIVVFFAAVIVTILLVSYVFPQFVTIVEGLDVDMPLPTKILIAITDITHNWMYVLLTVAILGLGTYIFYRFIQTPGGRFWFDGRLLRLPIFGPMNRKLLVSRFCRTTGTLMQSGLTTMNALDIVSKVGGNVVLEKVLGDVKVGVREGLRLSQCIKEQAFFPGVLAQMTHVGEESGHLSDIFGKLANYYDAELEATADSFSAIIEPFMIVGMGGVVAFILLAVFLPVYQVVSNFG